PACNVQQGNPVRDHQSEDLASRMVFHRYGNRIGLVYILPGVCGQSAGWGEPPRVGLDHARKRDTATGVLRSLSWCPSEGAATGAGRKTQTVSFETNAKPMVLQDQECRKTREPDRHRCKVPSQAGWPG